LQIYDRKEVCRLVVKQEVDCQLISKSTVSSFFSKEEEKALQLEKSNVTFLSTYFEKPLL